MYKYGPTLLFFFDKYLKGEGLGHMVGICLLFFKKLPHRYPEWLYRSIQEFQLLHIFVNSWHGTPFTVLIF